MKIDPVTIEFSNLNIEITSTFIFRERSSKIEIIREVTNSSDPNASVEFNEYMTACYGTTEYPEDMSNVVLTVRNEEKIKELKYAYKCREEELEEAQEACAIIPEIETKVTVSADGKGMKGYYREGYAFSPMFTLGLKKELKKGEVMRTWLNLQKEN